jgi:hypothetical protein
MNSVTTILMGGHINTPLLLVPWVACVSLSPTIVDLRKLASLSISPMIHVYI